MTIPIAAARPSTLPGLAKACCLGLLVLATACQNAADAASEAAIRAAAGTNVGIERDGDTTVLRGEDGTEARLRTGNDLALPEGFPDDIYLPGEYSLSSVAEMGPMTMVQLSSSEELGTVYANADQTMQAAGWKQVMAMRQASGSAVLAYEKEERRTSFTLSSGAGDDRTLVGVQVQEGEG